jgi:macrolide-specific efflux system membrane fusion protein
VVAGARTVHPEWRMVGTTVNATGTVRLRVGSEVRVGSQLSGIVKKLNVTVGSHVRARDVIVEIDDAPIQAVSRRRKHRRNWTAPAWSTAK